MTMMVNIEGAMKKMIKDLPKGENIGYHECVINELVSNLKEMRKRLVHGDLTVVKEFVDMYVFSEQSKCEHDWVNARNAVITTGEMCVKCFAIRAEQ